MINYKKDRQDLGYLPSDGEDLFHFAERLHDVAQQHRYSYSPPHENWYTHYGSAPCWICNIFDMLDYCISMLLDIAKNLKTRWVCVREKGQNDPFMFSFKPKKN